MIWLYRKFDVLAVLRPAGFLLLTAMFLVQVILPAAASNTLQCHTVRQVEAQYADDCTMHAAQSDGTAHVTSQTEGNPDSAMHCMPSMCSVYVSFESPKPVAVGTLLATDRWTEGRTVLPLHLRTTQDRPPRDI